MKYLIFFVFILCAPLAVYGHHSRAEFSDDERVLTGVITEVIWRNPHPAIFVEVTGADGQAETWRIEGWSSPRGLERSGVTGDLFVMGEQITIAGLPSRLRQSLLAQNALLASGTEALMAPGAKPRWDAAAVEQAEMGAPRGLAAARSEDRGLFRAWYPQGNVMMNLRRFSYGEEALAARADWDPVDNPIVRCETPGMPVPLFHAQPILFTDHAATLGLRHGYFDIQRTVHLDASLNPDTQPASPLGFSAGRWEDERTLIVETTRINYPYFDYSGTLQSDEIMVVERFSLSDDQSQLDYEVTITDPIALTEPASASWRYLALDQEFAPYECNVF